MCKMPYGIQDFKEIRLQEYVYVDKTKYIETLEKTGRKTVHFLRPRRFGKTLFTSMLQAYYDIQAEDEFETLFKGTYIYDHPTKEKNNYYILRFDFSGLNTDDLEGLKQTFHSHVYSRCKLFTRQYHLDLEVEKGIDAANCLSLFLDEMTVLLKKSIYVIIDEYDHFANELLSFHFDEFHKSVSKNGYVRKFYEVLKIGTFDSTIGNIFITGISPITLDSMTSGFTLCAQGCNISTNLSLDPRFNEMMGFNEDEMRSLINKVEAIEHPEVVLSDMKQIYDGYMFSIRGEHHLYNPNMALYYLDYYQSFGTPPLEIVDPNIYSDYKKIENLLHIKPDPKQRDVLNNILRDENIICNLTTSYDLSKQFTRDDFVSLLYYLGYLTIVESKFGSVTLRVPNDVIRKVYFDYFNAMLQQDFALAPSNDTEMIKEILVEKKNDRLVAKIEELLHTLDHRDYMKFDEKYIKLLAMSIISNSKLIHMKSEYAVPDGFIDLVFFPYQIEGATALIELKYIKEKDFTEEVLKQKREEAYAQLMKYAQAKEFQNIDVVKWILVFKKDKCILNETIE